MAIDAKFDGAMPFSETLAAVCEGCVLTGGEHKSFEGGRWGYIDSEGDLVIPMQFAGASRFENGRASVVLEGKKVIIDRSGNVVPD